MSVPLHTYSTRIAYKEETAYGCGNGSTIYTPVAFGAGDVASLTVMNMLKSDVSLGLPEVLRNRLKPATAGKATRVTFNQGYKYKEFTYEQYIQNSTWAINAATGHHAYQPFTNGSLTTASTLTISAGDYKIKMAVNGGTAVETTVTVTENMALGALNTALNAAQSVINFSIVGGIERATATSIDVTSVAITAGASADLLAGGLTALVGAAGVSTQKSLPSYVFHFEIPGVDGVMDYFDLVGCILTKYEIVMDGNEFPTERLTFVYYDCINSVAVTSLAALSDAAPSVHATINFYLDSTLYTDITQLTVTITKNTLDQMVATKYQRFDPLLESLDFDVDVTFFSDKASLMGDSLALGGTLTPSNPIDVKLIYYSSNFIQCTELSVDEETIGDIPSEMGLYRHNLKLKIEGVALLAHV